MAYAFTRYSGDYVGQKKRRSVLALARMRTTAKSPGAGGLGTALGPSAEARVNRLAMTEALRQIAPRDARPVALQHGIDERPIVLGRHPTWPSRPGSKPLIRSHSTRQASGAGNGPGLHRSPYCPT
jgi:hypothetical protein